MSKHTPGPWYWHTDSNGRVSLRTPDRGNLIVMDCARRGMQGAAPRFAHWVGMFGGASRDRMGGILEEFDIAHPDACLIAAAPDLLEALKDVTRIARAASIGVTGNAPRIERAQAAIAKATGATFQGKEPALHGNATGGAL